MEVVKRCSNCGAWWWPGRPCTPCSMLEHDECMSMWRRREKA